jgi:hypothetical protein
MKILAIDSSGMPASVAVCEDGTLLAEYTLNFKRTHSQTLVPMLDEVRNMLELDLESILQLMEEFLSFFAIDHSAGIDRFECVITTDDSIPCILRRYDLRIEPETGVALERDLIFGIDIHTIGDTIVTSSTFLLELINEEDVP